MVKLNMKTAARILLIVAATFINTDCFRTFEKRQDSGNFTTDIERCHDGITRCAPNIINQTLNPGSNNFGTLAANIDQVCIDYQNAEECLGRIIYCQSYERVLRRVERRFNFFCSDIGKSLLREFQQSVCYNNLPSMWDYFRTCDSGDSELSAITNGETVKQCAIRLLTADCGEAAGQVVFGGFYNTHG